MNRAPADGEGKYDRQSNTDLAALHQEQFVAPGTSNNMVKTTVFIAGATIHSSAGKPRIQFAGDLVCRTHPVRACSGATRSRQSEPPTPNAWASVGTACVYTIGSVSVPAWWIAARCDRMHVTCRRDAGCRRRVHLNGRTMQERQPFARLLQELLQKNGRGGRRKAVLNS